MSSLIFLLHFLRINICFRIFRILYRAFPQSAYPSATGVQTPSFERSEKSDAPDDINANLGTQDPQIHSQSRNAIREIPGHLGRHSPIGPWVRRLGTTTRDGAEALMAVAIALGNTQGSARMLGEDAHTSIGCAPDFIATVMLMGPAFVCKMHIMGSVYWSSQMRAADMARGLVDRIYRLCRDAAVLSRAKSTLSGNGEALSEGESSISRSLLSYYCNAHLLFP